MDPQTVQEIKPLVIRTAEGGILDVSLMSPKSHSKSIERDELWHLHRQTGRTLPYSERVDLQELKARENWYEAVVIVAGGQAEGSAPAGRDGAQPGVAQPGGRQAGSTQGSSRTAGQNSGQAAGETAAQVAERQAALEAAELEKPAALRQSSQNQHHDYQHQTYQHHASEEGQAQGPAQKPGPLQAGDQSQLPAEGLVPEQAADRQAALGATTGQAGERAAAPGGCGQVLERLEAIVEERRQTMPEGSYTTHLFSSGPEKIRKKAGEEAVELILASSREQIVFEAADVLYHMCVLLVSEGISYGEVCGELQERHATG